MRNRKKTTNQNIKKKQKNIKYKKQYQYFIFII